MIGRFVLIAWLTFVWIALWGDATLGNLIGGLLLATALSFAFVLRAPTVTEGTIRPLHAIVFFGFFAWKLFESSAIVAWEVITPKNRVTEAIVAVRLRSDSDAIATIVANSITLTPGTLAVELSAPPTTVYVHVLHFRSVEATRRSVARLERLVIKAFGPHALLASLEGEA